MRLKGHGAQLFSRISLSGGGPSALPFDRPTRELTGPPASRQDRRMRLILAGGALLASVVSSAEPPPATFTLGVLRRDAMVVPFATYDGKRWENHWPQPSQGVDVPVNLRSVPGRWWGKSGPLDTWQVWTDGAARLVHVRQPDWLQTHCKKQV